MRCMPMLTERQAFDAMRLFLQEFYDRARRRLSAERTYVRIPLLPLLYLATQTPSAFLNPNHS